MHQEGIAAVEQLNVGRAQVDAVGDKRLAVDKAKLVQPGDGLLAIVVVAVSHVVAVFRHMDMQAATGDLHRFAQHGQPLVGHGEGGVGTDMRFHQIGLAPLGFGRIDLLGEQDVLLHPACSSARPPLRSVVSKQVMPRRPASTNPLRSTFREPLMKLGDAWWSITALQPLLIASSEQMRPL